MAVVIFETPDVSDEQLQEAAREKFRGLAAVGKLGQPVQMEMSATMASEIERARERADTFRLCGMDVPDRLAKAIDLADRDDIARERRMAELAATDRTARPRDLTSNEAATGTATVADADKGMTVLERLSRLERMLGL